MEEKKDNKTERNNHWQIPVTIAFILLGILIVIQFRIQQKEGFPYSSVPVAKLASIINELEVERNKLQAEVQAQRERLNRYDEVTAEDQHLLKTLREQFLKAKLEAGLIPVRGEGIIIILQDSLSKPPVNEDSYFFIVHDVDLRSLITELWSAGAEAIAINEQRAIATTSIRCVGPSILVNTNRLLPPYEIKAIGPAEKLEAALRMTGGYMDSMALSIRNGVSIEIKQYRDIRIPAYNGPLVFEYASPDKEGE
ncbi:MAG: hypothetical protein BWY64_03686 [bacterium ADurb.Bin363]|nr:MAG: hypothetical protein BWY64_03686 [bacterium ADurb.Bin363]